MDGKWIAKSRIPDYFDYRLGSVSYLGENKIMKFGFIIHPRSLRELRTLLPPYGIPFLPFGTSGTLKELCLKKGLVKDLFEIKNVVSANGTSCSGKVLCVHLAPEQFLENQGAAFELLKRASNKLKDWGAEVIGLGGLTGVVGSRGKELNEQISIPVTSGNCFTVHSTVKVFDRIVKEAGVDLRGMKVTIVGFPGSISLAVSQILAKKGVNLVLVSKRETSFLKQFVSLIKDTTDAEVEFTNNLGVGLKMSKVILTATSTGSIIDPDILDKGTVVIDIAQPRDVIEKKKREDVLIVDGGIVTLPRNGRKKYNMFDWHGNDIPGCLGETILLALENRREPFSIGRKLPIEKIEEIGALGEKHGIVADNLISFKKPISNENFHKFIEIFKNN